MASKKRLKQRIRWYEKAFVQLEAERDEAQFERHMADADVTKAINDLHSLRVVTRDLVTELGKPDWEHAPVLAAWIAEARRLLDMDEAPNLRKAAEKPRQFRIADPFSIEGVSSTVKVLKFGEPGTYTINQDEDGYVTVPPGTYSIDELRAIYEQQDGAA